MKKRTTGCLVGIIAGAVAACCLTVGLVWVGVQEYKDLPRLVSGIDFGLYSPDAYAYSPDQESVLDELGTPRSFSILFYHLEDQDGNRVYVRYENWFYPDYGTSLTFENGVLVSQESMEPYPSVPTRYEPAIFTAFMNRESLATVADIDEWFILPVEDELLVDADLYYADGLTFGLQSGDLVYLEAVGVEDLNAPAVVLPDEPAHVPVDQPGASLTPEEQAAEGTHLYYAVFASEGEVFDQRDMLLEIVFAEEGLQLLEEGEASTFNRLGPNQYTSDEEEGFMMTFTADGFVWNLTGGLTDIEVTFTREE